MIAQQGNVISVGVREFHNRTSELMRAVAAGAVLEVTNRGKVIGRMQPAREDATYERLKRAGMIREPAPSDDGLPGPINLVPGVRVSELINEKRQQLAPRQSDPT